jgi:DNA (cytosine-5)-methyltransferase 1
MRVGSLFTGYGGLDMAVGGDLAWYAEIEPAACKVLAAHYPGVPNLGDITAVDWSQVEPVDVITGGYPCQPFSNAGKRKGADDERHLWPYVRDAIGAIRPRWAVLENVRGHLSLGFADVLADLADLGASARWGVVRAADAGAPHNRARLFIVADAAKRPSIRRWTTVGRGHRTTRTFGAWWAGCYRRRR